MPVRVAYACVGRSGGGERAAGGGAALVRAGPAGGPGGRRAAPASPRRKRRVHTADDYLQAIHLLSSPVVDCGAVLEDVPALAAHVSRVLGVSRRRAGGRP